MSDILSELSAIRKEEIGRIRREAEFPQEDDEFDGVTSDDLWRYIEKLEAVVVGQRSAMKTIGKGLRL